MARNLLAAAKYKFLGDHAWLSWQNGKDRYIVPIRDCQTLALKQYVLFLLPPLKIFKIIVLMPN